MKYSIYLNRRVFVMKNDFDSTKVNEPSVFESSRLYCISWVWGVDWKKKVLLILFVICHVLDVIRLFVCANRLYNHWMHVKVFFFIRPSGRESRSKIDRIHHECSAGTGKSHSRIQRSCGNSFPHYENTPIQIHWKFYNEKGKFSDKKFWYFSYSCGSNEYPQSMFFSKI